MFEIKLHVFWIIRNVNWFNVDVLFDANVKIVFYNFDLIKSNNSNDFEFKFNRIFVSSLVFSIFNEIEYIASINALHLSSNLILILSLYWIDDHFFIRLFLINLYVWKTSFSIALFRKFDQDFFFAVCITWKQSFRFFLNIDKFFFPLQSFIHTFYSREIFSTLSQLI
jgi:hypothetical protein